MNKHDYLKKKTLKKHFSIYVNSALSQIGL